MNLATSYMSETKPMLPVIEDVGGRSETAGGRAQGALGADARCAMGNENHDTIVLWEYHSRDAFQMSK